MDHRDRSESPSVVRAKLIEKRMEMISRLINRLNEEEMKEEESKAEAKRKSRGGGIVFYNWLGHFVHMVHRMLL
ncbi:hypothetical protein [Paenibacillus arenilitoris]|uniref:Uncharacterized protein n=1 Tax=Paenibacillus arenilitoris TaxID=2772299 RepID=A0A927CP82_9BACL|nr:hypothetical protein [Paenibacillus arenilitoris]MBD2871005.1 hypothetical protein [Paenibacillus arenilitoris]